MTPPKPPSRPDRVSLWRYLRLFRADILSAQPARLYRAWMAEFRTPFFRSYLCNDPDLVDLVLRTRPDDFPKSDRIAEGLRPLLGNSVFVTNGETWRRQRRIIDPAFEGGRVREVLPAIWQAGQAAVSRLRPLANGSPQEIEAETSHLAADVIFRTLFSIPIDHQVAEAVFTAFQAHQRAQPIVNLAALFPLPRVFPRFHARRVRQTARQIRRLITQLTEDRMAEIAAGIAPDDLATKIMTTPDPETGQIFDAAEMVDQVAIFFLAGHETSASALAWALYLLATHPDWQHQVAAEAAGLPDDTLPSMSDLARLKVTRNVFRETLRLYPPVPMMVRQTTRAERFRDRDVPPGAQIVLSPWYLHRHERLWHQPDEFDPGRFEDSAEKDAQRRAFIPFSAGQRVCTGASFAMAEGTLLLAMLMKYFVFSPQSCPSPKPVAKLTLRSLDGIYLQISPRLRNKVDQGEKKSKLSPDEWDRKTT